MRQPLPAVVISCPALARGRSRGMAPLSTPRTLRSHLLLNYKGKISEATLDLKLSLLCLVLD